MKKTFTYKRRSISEEDHQGAQPCCGNCDLMDIFVMQKDRQAFSVGGSKAAFKDEHGNITGTSDDDSRMFCVLTAASVRPGDVCKKHIWATDEWVNPDNEMTLC